MEYNGQSQVAIEYLYFMLNARCGGARERNSTRPGSGRIKNQIRTNNTDPLLRKIAIRWQFIIIVTALHTHVFGPFTCSEAKGCVIRTENQLHRTRSL